MHLSKLVSAHFLKGLLALPILAVGVGCSMEVPQAVAVESSDTLTIGSDAPAIDIEHWVHKDQKKWNIVTKLEPNKVYVIEFWATWCGPCIGSMPHLVSLQKKFADKGVQVISITDEDMETVNEFLDREYVDDEQAESESEGPKPKTYRELTQGYSLTADPDGSVSKDYFQAAKQSGIPCAFVVGKDSKIEWIGHPMQMDEPLEKIVQGTWDREAFAKQFKFEQELDQKMNEVRTLAGQGDSDGAIKILDELIAQSSDPNAVPQLKIMKFQVMLNFDFKNPEFPNVVKDTLTLTQTINPRATNAISWMLYQAMQENGKSEVILATVVSSLTDAISKSKGVEKGMALDTLAHLQSMQGKREEAIESAKQAVELAGESEEVGEDLRRYLKELTDEETKK